jgi:hypothetical protein
VLILMSLSPIAETNAERSSGTVRSQPAHSSTMTTTPMSLGFTGVTDVNLCAGGIDGRRPVRLIKELVSHR